MNTSQLALLAAASPKRVVGIAILFSALAATPVTTAQAQNEATDDANVEVLTSGPVHEAFAELTALDPEPSAIVDRQPPEPIQELPPAVKPEGADVVWIPGYWHWDPERKDFIWISGVYRKAPPNRRWVPGYWMQAENGWRRVSGFWAEVDEKAVDYLPQPPDSLEVGPSSPAPSDNHFWVPGCWNWQGSQFAWTAGYWGRMQPNWIWYPSRYYWTPSGCVYNSGYWDYLYPSRGLLYAPLYYHRPVYAHANYFYRPSIVWNVARLAYFLFARPFDCHYYYGDFYGPSNAGLGIIPWYSYWHRPGFYDPYWHYCRWDWHRRPWDRDFDDWDDFQRGRYEHLRDNDDDRPPRTFTELSRRHLDQRAPERDIAERRRLDGSGEDRVALRAEELANRRGTALAVERLSDERRDQLRANTERWRQLQDNRRNAEIAVRRRDATPEGPGVERPRTGQTTAPRRADRFQLPEVFDPGERATRQRAESSQRMANGERQPANRQQRIENFRGRHDVGRPDPNQFVPRRGGSDTTADLLPKRSSDSEPQPRDLTRSRNPRGEGSVSRPNRQFTPPPRAQLYSGQPDGSRRWSESYSRPRTTEQFRSLPNRSPESWSRGSQSIRGSDSFGRGGGRFRQDGGGRSEFRSFGGDRPSRGGGDFRGSGGPRSRDD